MSGASQTSITTVGGFSFAAVPTVSTPDQQAIIAGDSAVFAVATGFPVEVVTWQVSQDGGATWQETVADSLITVSADGREARVVADASQNGVLYRATEVNDQGVAAVLIVGAGVFLWCGLCELGEMKVRPVAT